MFNSLSNGMETRGRPGYPINSGRLMSPQITRLFPSLYKAAALRAKCLRLLKRLHRLNRESLSQAPYWQDCESEICLLEVEREEKAGRFPLFHAATSDELETFREHFLKGVGFRSPDEYIDLLSMVDGVDLESFTLYGTASENSSAPGFLEQNGANPELLRNGLIVFGLSGTDLAVWDQTAGIYQLMTQANGRVVRHFSCFWDMIAFTLAQALKEYSKNQPAGERGATGITGKGKRKRKSSSR